MKLGKSVRDELRKKVESQLALVPDGQRIHLEKEVLEELLFDKITLNREGISMMKLPVWSGPFLSKIDLSEISFEDVSWGVLNDKDSFLDGYYRRYFGDEDMIKFLEKKTCILDVDSCDFSYGIDYSNTNANINFSESWECKNLGEIKLDYCNFSGVDLSKNDFSSLTYMGNCNLSNTGIKLSSDIFAYIDLYTDLSNNDFSNITINADDLFYTPAAEYGCDYKLKNTGINIIYTTKVGVRSELIDYLGEFNDAREKGYFDGCYFNGKLLKSTSTKEQQEAIKASKKEEYEKFKNEIFESVMGSIDEQIGGKKR